MAFSFELFGLLTNISSGVLINRFGYKKAFLASLFFHSLSSRCSLSTHWTAFLVWSTSFLIEHLFLIWSTSFLIWSTYFLIWSIPSFFLAIIPHLEHFLFLEHSLALPHNRP